MEDIGKLLGTQRPDLLQQLAQSHCCCLTDGDQAPEA
jgi:hypothetical protein